ncbi:MAG TPA: DUF1326 domain-containing protein [Candidatus Acidoferrales bacterium]|nr:DUF1326 domain-containing protein [Candidatus Acidoferrales bacterium]
MKTKWMAFSLAALMAIPALAQAAPKGLTGQYMEFRSADVYTGPCFANSEMGLAGKNAVLAWKISQGSWHGVALDGMSVVAVVRASNTLGDPDSNPLPARSVLIVDRQATGAQRAALENFARTQAGALLANVVAVESAPITMTVNAKDETQAALAAGGLVKLETRAIGMGDMICHNEEVYYSPLVRHLNCPMPAVVVDSAYTGNHLGVTWQDSGRRSAFVATFAM